MTSEDVTSVGTEDQRSGGPQCAFAQVGPSGLLCDEGSSALSGREVIRIRIGLERGALTVGLANNHEI